jgi:23S rRNA pseudouridine955/2504/2580 synthase/23S rRNA pseudouridine1911/1915/1917 synthase
LWDIELHTGKFHQIRVQLAELNCSILGDEFYGSSSMYKPDAIALHAVKLIIEHPITHKQIEFVADTKSFFIV